MEVVESVPAEMPVEAAVTSLGSMPEATTAMTETTAMPETASVPETAAAVSEAAAEAAAMPAAASSVPAPAERGCGAPEEAERESDCRAEQGGAAT